ncbi:MAG TPA: HNH endonuclease signature motif containing protein [Thermomicrobiaceae bacterium]|nr:HNH endonuclease signature motif containing protein [Thermomicrobiaceae bacterium]
MGELRLTGEMAGVTAAEVIGTILRHDRKTTSYKIALIRGIGDLVAGYPTLGDGARRVAVPLRMLADCWVAYYWPFADAAAPILQGRPAGEKQDIAFRPALSALRLEWADFLGSARPADGFFLISELRVPRRRALYPPALLAAYARAVDEIVRAIQQPIHYAGPGEWSVFPRPQRLHRLDDVVPLPASAADDLCLVVDPELWRAFRDLSLWIEALCIHEWCLYTETVSRTTRGEAYTLLTDRPDNRRPLTWERNQVELLMMEGRIFTCPWTGSRVTISSYDLDHIVPVSLYPLNELWNLVPADRHFNEHVKRDRLPTDARLLAAVPRLAGTYALYEQSSGLSGVLASDFSLRFTAEGHALYSPSRMANVVADYVTALADARNVARF